MHPEVGRLYLRGGTSPCTQSFKGTLESLAGEIARERDGDGGVEGSLGLDSILLISATSSCVRTRGDQFPFGCVIHLD